LQENLSCATYVSIPENPVNASTLKRSLSMHANLAIVYQRSHLSLESSAPDAGGLQLLWTTLYTGVPQGRVIPSRGDRFLADHNILVQLDVKIVDPIIAPHAYCKPVASTDVWLYPPRKISSTSYPVAPTVDAIEAA
jgi:hypothetical protein